MVRVVGSDYEIEHDADSRFPGYSSGYAPIRWRVQSGGVAGCRVYGFREPDIDGSLSDVRKAVRFADRLQKRLATIAAQDGPVRTPGDLVIRLAALAGDDRVHHNGAFRPASEVATALDRSLEAWEQRHGISESAPECYDRPVALPGDGGSHQ